MLGKKLIEVLARRGLSTHDSMYNAFNIMLVADGVRSAFTPTGVLQTTHKLKEDAIFRNKIRLHNAIIEACDQCGIDVVIVPFTHEGYSEILVCNSKALMRRNTTFYKDVGALHGGKKAGHAVLGRVLGYDCVYRFGKYNTPTDSVSFIVRMSSNIVHVLSYWCRTGYVKNNSMEKLNKMHACLQRHFGKLHVELHVEKYVDP